MDLTKEKYVVANNGRALYLQKDGTWGPYKTAKRFRDQEIASKVCDETPGGVGIWPCPRRRKWPVK